MAAHRYWRLRLPAIDGTYGYADIAEVRFLDRNLTRLTGGTATSSAFYDNNSSYNAAKAFDNSVTSYCSLIPAATMYLGYTFTAAVEPVFLHVIPSRQGNDSALNLAYIVEWSDDGAAWTVQRSDLRMDGHVHLIGPNVAAVETAAHRYWRIVYLEYQGFRGDGPAANAAKVRMRESLTGVDVCSGGAANRNAELSTTYAASKAFDTDPNSYWYSGNNWGTTPNYICYTFASGVTRNIVNFNIQTDYDDELDTAFKSYAVQWSDNGTTWVTSWIETGIANWNSKGQTREFTAPGIVAPAPTGKRYWRFRVQRCIVDNRFPTIHELQLRNTVGGVTQVGFGATISNNPDGNPSNAFDGSTTTGWDAQTADDAWVGYDFGPTNWKSIVEVVLTATVAEYAPLVAHVESSADAVTWTHEWMCLTPSATAPSAVVFTKPAVATTALAWAAVFSASQDSATMTQVADMEMRATYGGPDQCTGGTARGSAIDGYSTATIAGRAFDTSNTTVWFSEGRPVASFLAYTFAAAVAVKEIAILAPTPNGYPDTPPTQGEMYYGTDGRSFLRAWSFSGLVYTIDKPQVVANDNLAPVQPLRRRQGMVC